MRRGLRRSTFAVSRLQQQPIPFLPPLADILTLSMAAAAAAAVHMARMPPPTTHINQLQQDTLPSTILSKLTIQVYIPLPCNKSTSELTLSPVASPYSHDGGGYAPPQQYFPPNQQYRTPEQSMPISSVQNAHEHGSPMTYAQDQYKGALNRNLIGSVSASAFHLHDPQGEEGMWFVLQDLSVRLEGNYR